MGICRDLPVFVVICGDLQGSAGICLASHSETLCNLVVGPGVESVAIRDCYFVSEGWFAICEERWVAVSPPSHRGEGTPLG